MCDRSLLDGFPLCVGEATYVLHAVMAWQVSPVQNSEMVLYCRLIRLKNVVAVGEMAEIMRLLSGKTVKRQQFTEKSPTRTSVSHVAPPQAEKE